MHLATWNLERLDKRKTNQMIEILKGLDADILVLTETSSDVVLEGYHLVATKPLPVDYEGIPYKPGENRVTIYTKYNILNQYPTYDEYTTVCVEVDTPFGALVVYGTIIGVFGSKQPKFNNDLYGQIEDFDIIFPNKDVCIAGDFNITFTGRVWPSKVARQTILDVQEKFNLVSETQKVENAVDHIFISESFVKGRTQELTIWNQDKKLSDHEGYLVSIV